MKLGARVLKTGVAIVFALFIAQSLNLPSPVFAGIAAIFAIQPTLYRSYLTIIEQIQGNLIGAATAVTFGLLFGHHIVAVGIAAIIVMAIMLKLKLDKSLSLALVTLIAIMEVQGDDFLLFGLIRFGTVMVGVVAAFIVNIVFIPPKYEVKLFKKMNSLQDDIIRWTRLAVRQASEHTSGKMAIKKLSTRLDDINTLYNLYKEECHYRKRQMLLTSKKSLELLQRLNKHENELAKLPENLSLMLQQRLDFLLTYHEQLLLKYTGKLRPEHSKWTRDENFVQSDQIMDIFIEYIAESKKHETPEQFSSYHLLYILSCILDYEENLEHLDTLIMAYRNHHGKEMNLDLETEFY